MMLRRVMTTAAGYGRVHLTEDPRPAWGEPDAFGLTGYRGVTLCNRPIARVLERRQAPSPRPRGWVTEDQWAHGDGRAVTCRACWLRTERMLQEIRSVRGGGI